MSNLRAEPKSTANTPFVSRTPRCRNIRPILLATACLLGSCGAVRTGTASSTVVTEVSPQFTPFCGALTEGMLRLQATGQAVFDKDSAGNPRVDALIRRDDGRVAWLAPDSQGGCLYELVAAGIEDSARGPAVLLHVDGALCDDKAIRTKLSGAADQVAGSVLQSVGDGVTRRTSLAAMIDVARLPCVPEPDKGGASAEEFLNSLATRGQAARRVDGDQFLDIVQYGDGEVRVVIAPNVVVAFRNGVPSIRPNDRSGVGEKAYRVTPAFARYNIWPSDGALAPLDRAAWDASSAREAGSPETSTMGLARRIRWSENSNAGHRHLLPISWGAALGADEPDAVGDALSEALPAYRKTIEAALMSKESGARSGDGGLPPAGAGSGLYGESTANDGDLRVLYLTSGIVVVVGSVALVTLGLYELVDGHVDQAAANSRADAGEISPIDLDRRLAVAEDRIAIGSVEVSAGLVGAALSGVFLWLYTEELRHDVRVIHGVETIPGGVKVNAGYRF